jgi:hypothetical protein
MSATVITIPNTKQLVTSTAVVTTTVVLTASTLHVAGMVIAPRIKKLTAKLERRNEKNN